MKLPKKSLEVKFVMKSTCTWNPAQDLESTCNLEFVLGVQFGTPINA